MIFSARAVFWMSNVPMVILFLLAGCVFNNTGLAGPAPDGASTGQDKAIDTDGSKKDGQGAFDSRADYAFDRGNDQQMDSECANSHSLNVCHAQAASPGQSGTCVGSTFVLDLHCFSGAPCVQETGLCTPPSGCTPCSAECSGVCTAFINSQSAVEVCCVGTSKNGTGTALTSCTRDQQHLCKTGLCTSDGNCFEDCSTDSGQCPKDPKKTVCGFVTVKIGPVEAPTLGCQIQE